jgi:hypothetical protein
MVGEGGKGEEVAALSGRDVAEGGMFSVGALVQVVSHNTKTSRTIHLVFPGGRIVFEWDLVFNDTLACLCKPLFVFIGVSSH